MSPIYRNRIQLAIRRLRKHAAALERNPKVVYAQIEFDPLTVRDIRLVCGVARARINQS